MIRRKTIQRQARIWAMGLMTVGAAATPAWAGDFSIGGFFTTGGHGGTAIGVQLDFGWPAPIVAPTVAPVFVQPPVRTERIWVPEYRIEYRQVPIVDAWGRIIAYREEQVQVDCGHWVTRVTPAYDTIAYGAGRVQPVVAPLPVAATRQYAPPPGTLPRVRDGLRQTLPIHGHDGGLRVGAGAGWRH